MWEELEADKKYHSDNSAKCYGTAVSLTHTAVFLGSVIKTPDGLGTLGDSDADGHKYLIYLGNNTNTGNGNITSIYGICSIITQNII